MSDKVKVPTHLQPETKAWFRRVCRDYVLEPHHVRLLIMAGEAWDRSNAAREVLEKDGLTYQDRFGAPRLRPEVKIKEQAETNFRQLLRELSLDVEPPSERARARLPY